MVQSVKQSLWAALLISCLVSVSATAQTMLDVSVGTSRQDNVFTNIALRRQVSDRFRAGVEVQLAAPRYRFISAGKPITEGYAVSLSVPLMWRVYERDRIRLDVYSRVGVRQQGVIDPDGNDNRDTRLESTALFIDPGLLVNIRATDKLNIQSGVTLPVFFEVSPRSLLENNVTTVLGGLSYALSDQKVFFAKALMGPAAGGSGDTQKFVWSVQAGLRFSLGKSRPASSLVVEPSY